MKSKILAAVTMAAGLSLAAAGVASASPVSRSATHQSNGLQLQAALLPSSVFGDGFYGVAAINTGSKLWSSVSDAQLSKTSCGEFQAFGLRPAFGKTAQAQEDFTNPNPITDFPFTIFNGSQVVNQFASATAAATFYNQALAKFKACRSFSVASPGLDTVPGGGSIEIDTRSVSNMTVSGHHAFAVLQLAAYSDASGAFFNLNQMFALAGTNVYQLYETSGANDVPSAAIMSRLISSVQRLS